MLPIVSNIRSFGAKITLLVTLTTGLAVLLVCTTLAFLDYWDTKHQTVVMAEAQANIVAMNSEAPLSFEDRKSGTEALMSLAGAPEVAGAYLFTPNGELFASYTNPGSSPPRFSLNPPGHQVKDGWLIVTKAVPGASGPLGRLQLVVDMSPMRAQAWSNAGIVLATAALTTLIAFLAATRIKRFLARPVAELAATAKRVSIAQDYSIRATKYSDDELGQLTDIINEMLARIQSQSEELEARQKQFRLAVEAAPNAMVMVDDQGRIILVNSQAEQLFGYRREELIGQSVEILVPERLRGQHPMFRAQFFADPQARPMGAGRELSGRHRDGYEIPVEIALNPIQTDEGLRVLSSIVDVTERQRATEQNARLAAIVSQSNDAIIGKALDGIMISFNPAAERMYGYQAEEVIGKHVSILYPPDHADDWDHLLESIRSGHPIEAYETVRQRKDGTLIDVSVSISPTRAADGRLTGVSSIARDITERKRVEQQRLQVLEAERAARTEVERASRMKDEFVATLSHELRTPLSAILGWAQMLRNESPAAEEVARGMEIIERNARVQMQIIEDLLDMSRIVSGKVRLDVQQVNLAEVIEAALTTVRPAAEAKAIRLQTTIDPRSAPVRGDASRLQQVVWNLLTNAIKFTPRGGRVQVSLERVNSHVEIIISDTGQGIKPEFLPFVFERFRQADSSTTRRHTGLGLGLAIVKQLVELHGGTVRARSPGEGHGATFSVELPLMVVHHGHHEGEAARVHPQLPSVAPTLPDQPSLSGVKVLVVDDEPDARDLVSRLLQRCHATVSCAGSASEALAIFRNFKPSVLVSDIGMPYEDGYELIRKIRTEERKLGLRTQAVALTAFARSEDRTRALLAGYQMHLSKPVEASELIATVASLAGLNRPADSAGQS